jgi:two-component system, chemotaxis family, chemotaxis protein CheY
MTTILIVDDTAEDRKKAVTILNTAGYRIIGTASTGEDGIQKYKELNPDLVMIDVIMPGMNGIDTLREIRTLNASAQIILCTSVGKHDIINLAMRSGANGYIVKPYDSEILLTAIRRIIENI